MCIRDRDQVFGSVAQTTLYDLRKDPPQDPGKPDAKKESRGHFMFFVTTRVAVPGRPPENASSAKADWIFPKIDFRESTVTEIAEFLVKKSAQLDPTGQSTNIV